MRILVQVYRTYLEVDEQYARIEHEARLRGHVRKESEVRMKREYYDQATFLYLFSRLEGRINDYAKRLILAKRAGLSKWRIRRPWDTLDPGNIDRIPFMSRVALLTDKGRTDYALIDEYYTARNEIAHGDVWSEPVAVPTVYSEIRRLYSELRP